MSWAKVTWLSWGKEAFQKSKNQDIPILLDISAVWCHWCHVMDQTTYSDVEVIKLIEEKFVPIRVDRDQRPDIDKRYNMGGWPTTVILTPEGNVITGTTYIPPQQMKNWLQNISDFYKKNQHQNIVKAKSKELKRRTKKSSMPRNFNHEALLSIIDDLTLKITSNFDSMHGGFGSAPKFPHSEALALALLEHHIQGHKALLNIVKKTLHKMGQSGIYDKEDGGFFRYSTTRDWSLPHYEKMCEDNAKLLVNYLQAFQATGEKEFKETARGILEYVDTNLNDQENGGFYGSQDADEEYYKLNFLDRQKRTAPRIDKTLYTNWNAMMISAYLYASVVLKDRSYLKTGLRALDFLLEKSFNHKNGMYHYYSNGVKQLSGLLSDQIFMMKCLIDTYQTTADRQFIGFAESVAEFMLSNLWSGSEGFYDRPKDAHALGFLRTIVIPFEENCAAIDAFLRLHYLTDKRNYIEVARKTLKHLASSYQRYGLLAAAYGLAIELYQRPMQIHIVGSEKDRVVQKFLNESLKVYNPLKVVEILDPVTDAQRLEGLKYPITDTPKAYVCFSGTCTAIERPEEIDKEVYLGLN
ncbi:MAG: thioredoxin domain-containing protein [Candidatus Bathyarchaeota archaeon]|nr:MAG: thioredoxin domain-containing protein [Candidatus Bathyarchaeota archaeon]